MTIAIKVVSSPIRVLVISICVIKQVSAHQAYYVFLQGPRLFGRHNQNLARRIKGSHIAGTDPS